MQSLIIFGVVWPLVVYGKTYNENIAGLNTTVSRDLKGAEH